MSDKRPVGFFDSGIGGTCILAAFRALCPKERTIYHADSEHCPYGNRPAEEIIRLSEANTQELLRRGCKMVVVACNTATAAAIADLRESYPDIPFIGMEPAVKPAAIGTRTGVIGVLATAGTLKGSKYLNTKGKYEDDVKIVEHVGQGFVELVEACDLDSPKAEEIVRESVTPLLAECADTIVLGCTHYPFLAPVIQRIAGDDVTVIDPAPAVARQTVNVMQQRGLLPAPLPEPAGTKEAPKVKLLSSGASANLERLFQTLLIH